MRRFALIHFVLIGLGLGASIWREVAPILPPLNHLLASEGNAQVIVASIVVKKPVYTRKSHIKKRTKRKHQAVQKSPAKTVGKHHYPHEFYGSFLASTDFGSLDLVKAKEENDPLIGNIQRELRRLGCYEGVSTGDWDQNTSAAVSRFSQRAHLGEPIGQSHEFFASLQKYENNFCRPGMNVSLAGVSDAYLPPWQKPEEHVLLLASFRQGAHAKGAKISTISGHRRAKHHSSISAYRGKKSTWSLQRKHRKFVRKRVRRHNWNPTGWPQGRW
jgi:hypothetical protein